MEVSEIEMERIKKFARENSKKKKFFGRKIAGIAAAILLAFGGILGTNESVRAEVISYVEKFFTEVRVPINEAKGVPEEVQKYAVNLHETVQLKHISFVVEDVMVDGKDGYLNLIYPEEYSEKNTNEIYYVARAYVNGERVFVNTASRSPRAMGNGLISDMMEFSIDKEFPKDEDFDLIIEFENFKDLDDKAAIQVRISMADLTADSKIYLKDFEIPNSDGRIINMMKINLINPRIEMTEPLPTKNYDNYIEIVGTNDKGEKIVFAFSHGRNIDDTAYYTGYGFVEKDDKYYDNLSDFTIEELYNLKDTFEFQIYKISFDREPESGKWKLLKTEVLGDPFIVDFSK